jgi:hypothetical protein
MNCKECGTAHLLVSYSCHCQRQLGPKLTVHLSNCHFSFFLMVFSPLVLYLQVGMHEQEGRHHQGMWVLPNLPCPQLGGFHLPLPLQASQISWAERSWELVSCLTPAAPMPTSSAPSHGPPRPLVASAHNRGSPLAMQQRCRPSTSLPPHCSLPMLHTVQFFVVNVVTTPYIIYK